MEISGDYYLDSLNELEIDSWLYRTEGSSQIQFWHDNRSEKPDKRFISYRRYFRGKYKGRRFFAKQFLNPYAPSWSIKRCIEYQFENLLLFSDIRYVPEPLFLTEDTIGMAYVKGETIKNLSLGNKLTDATADRIISQLWEKGPVIIDTLGAIDRSYDCSYNNILVIEHGEIVFVDFDYAENMRPLVDLVQVIKDLKKGTATFDENGNLHYKSILSKLVRKFKRISIGQN